MVGHLTKGLATFTQLVKVRRGKLVLALPIFTNLLPDHLRQKTTIFSWNFDLFLTFFINCGHKCVPIGVSWGSTSKSLFMRDMTNTAYKQAYSISANETSGMVWVCL